MTLPSTYPPSSSLSLSLLSVTLALLPSFTHKWPIHHSLLSFSYGAFLQIDRLVLLRWLIFHQIMDSSAYKFTFLPIFLLLLAQKWFFSWWFKLHLGSNFHLLDACMILRDMKYLIGQIWCGYLTSGLYSIPTNLPSKVNLYFFFLHGGLFRSPWYLPSIWEICMRG